MEKDSRFQFFSCQQHRMELQGDQVVNKSNYELVRTNENGKVVSQELEDQRTHFFGLKLQEQKLKGTIT